MPTIPIRAASAAPTSPRVASPGRISLAALPPLAIYIHIPWCVRKCPYCDFNSHQAAGAIPEDDYLRALEADLQSAVPMVWGRIVHSVFIGGGTPSLLAPASIDRLLASVRALYKLSPEAEITLEANPSSVEAARFADLAEAGVNRVSLGLQALDDEALRFLGRAHGLQEGLAALDTAQAAFQRVSFDLIYALPGQNEDAWAAELARALSFGTGHLSLYQLTIEPGTWFQRLYDAGKITVPDEETGRALYDITQETCEKHGLPAYEISNHARPGAESRHNLLYWRYGEYAGIGPGAHGRRCGKATQRHRKPENWLAALARNGHGIQEELEVPRRDQAVEALLMGLRLREGVDLARFPGAVWWRRPRATVKPGPLVSVAVATGSRCEGLSGRGRGGTSYCWWGFASRK